MTKEIDMADVILFQRDGFREDEIFFFQNEGVRIRKTETHGVSGV